jgi:hypothetical protein
LDSKRLARADRRMDAEFLLADKRLQLRASAAENASKLLGKRGNTHAMIRALRFSAKKTPV